MLAVAADSYLETLKPEQRRAVEHGIRPESTIGPPLLVIAGAGSGKTNALAHRVAHLIINGEMTKRVERIARKMLGDNAGVMTDALTWSGTFTGRAATAGIFRPDWPRSFVHNSRPRGFRRSHEPDPT